MPLTPGALPHWPRLSVEERQERAQRAAETVDAGVLWTLTQAHLARPTAKGALLSPLTQRRYRGAIQHFLAFCQQNALSIAEPPEALGPQYLAALEEAGRSPSSLRIHVSAVRALYRALRWAKVTRLDPLIDVALPPEARTTPETERYSAAEVQTLLSHASARDRVLIGLCHERQLRIEDAVTLKWKEVDLQRGVLLRSAFNPRLSPNLLGALQALPQGAPEAPIIGASQTAARQRLNALALKAGVPYRGWKAF